MIEDVNELVHDYQQGGLSRRVFLKRALLIGLSLPMAVALLEACSAPAASSSAAAGSPSVAASAAASVAASPSGSGKALRAGLVTIQAQGDLGPVDSMVKGLNRGKTDLGYEVRVVEALQGEYTEAVRALAAEGFDLIFGTFPPMKDTMTEVAPQFPDQKFAIVIGSTDDVIPNVKGMWENGQDGTYLLGALGAMMTKTNKLAGVFAIRNPEIDSWIAGYQRGIEATNPQVEFKFSIIGGDKPFEDPAKAKELALLAHEQGADIVFGNGGKSQQGVLEAAADGGFIATGTDTDQCLARPETTVASMLIMEDPMVYDTMKEVKEGTFKGGNYYLGIKEGAIDLCPYTTAPHVIGPTLAPEIVSAISKAHDDIASGAIKIDLTVKE